MNRTIRYAFSLLLVLGLFAFTAGKKKPRILVFSKTKGFHHASITVGAPAIYKLGQENGFDVDTTSDADVFTRKGLKKYAAVVFLSTTGDVLDNAQQEAFQKFIRSGKGYVGVHAAADTEYDWPWYNQLAGAYFKSHPKQQEASLQIVDANNPATSHLPNPWKRKDEWYNYKSIQNGLHVLINLDEKSYTGGANGDLHPIAWYHDFDGGRAFYTGLGHTDESYSDPLFLGHLLAGIRYAMNR
ncbi:ThuA domain-containing protein [Sediminibacterium soli]|uniref:ThuA domain-containing protein n=1 Tax=Sediminibacterium soli TaxID=2698829 RepID=UPI00137A3C52|nr:ThuA domain-containing protein [Sediminibacterium soli]NCI48102.1 ThuA domain-containing protein [Sediminibacterium soli]